jgi:catechol 2,3-dioxygenase-like lactoylglutathione lyase family enzyme
MQPNLSYLLRLDHYAVHVASLEVSAAFYERVFGFGVVHKWTTVWMVGNDRIRVGLFQRPEATAVADPNSKLLIEHVAFLTDKIGFEQAIKTLEALGIAYEAPEDTGIAMSLFFKDPDGHNLEVTYYY